MVVIDLDRRKVSPYHGQSVLQEVRKQGNTRHNMTCVSHKASTGHFKPWPNRKSPNLNPGLDDVRLAQLGKECSEPLGRLTRQKGYPQGTWNSKRLAKSASRLERAPSTWNTGDQKAKYRRAGLILGSTYQPCHKSQRPLCCLAPAPDAQASSSSIPARFRRASPSTPAQMLVKPG